jgi:hypothetical protein
VEFEQAPFIQNGTTLVPFRPIFEQLGLLIRWNQDTQTIEGKNLRLHIKLTVGQREAVVNDKPVTLEVASI